MPHFSRPPLVLLLAASAAAAAAPGSAPVYPAARMDAVIEAPFGEPVSDPYRWLEADPRVSPQVADWLAAQAETTRAALAALPAREWFAAHIRAAIDRERPGLPRKAGGRYFYQRDGGADGHARLWVRDGLHGRLLLDPADPAAGDAATLDRELWEPSPRGHFLAYGLQRDGSDWRDIAIVDTRTGLRFPETLHWVYDSRIDWIGEEGFLYSRFAQPADGERSRAPLTGRSVWFHRPGTPQTADEPVHATPAHPDWSHRARVTSDGRYAVIFTSAGSAVHLAVRVIDLAARRKGQGDHAGGGHAGGSHAGGGWASREIVAGFDDDWRLVDGVGRTLWFVTNRGAPRYRLLAVDLSGKAPRWRQVIGEQQGTLRQATVIGRRLLLAYSQDGATRAMLFDLDGRHADELSLGEYGNAAGFRGRPGDPETFFAFSSFTRPPTIFRYDVATGSIAPFAVDNARAAPARSDHRADYQVDRVTFPSRDGTPIPMFIVRRRDVVASGRPVPTLLTGYGGFDISVVPAFSPARLAWLDAGGAFALALLRGGGEFGTAWHDAGRAAHKQNTFDDFIAAGEWLIANRIAPKDGLAIQGASNGGLLVAAAVNQRPDLFAAANPQSGVLDMLRFDRFTAGRFWYEDYGRPDVAADWKVLRAYSPLHNITPGARYPAILVTTGDADNRVVPAHSYKYVAALQAAPLGDRPRLLRVEPGSGHGGGRSAGRSIAESADILAFLARWTGLDPLHQPRPAAPEPIAEPRIP